MLSRFRYLRFWLTQSGFLPLSKTAQVAWYVLGLDFLLFVLQKIFAALSLSYADDLGGWIVFLSVVSVLLFAFLAARWTKNRMLWRLRNRLIVTYVFIGVIPVLLLVGLAMGSFYLFAGQFATYIVTTGLNSELSKLDASNSTITHQLAAQIQQNPTGQSAMLDSLRRRNEHWVDRQVCVWLNAKLLLNGSPGDAAAIPLNLPKHLKTAFHEVARDDNRLFLRAAETVPVGNDSLTVISSEPLGQRMLQELASNLGQVTLFEGLSLKLQPAGSNSATNPPKGISVNTAQGQHYDLDTSKAVPLLTAGSVPSPTGNMDRQVSFSTSVFAVDWASGDSTNPAGISVQTRVSKLYERLFAALGDFAPVAEIIILIALAFFAIFEMVAIGIGYHLTRTVTGAVASLYEGTQHVNRGDFSHRIPVRSNDQIATLSTSFNSMTESLEKLIEEQKQKQRLENELVIAQEVQAQLFPRQISQLASLEVHGFCRPARTVSGDYYDFLKLDADKMILAVGDISGKGISAALLMATIHSAVRAYTQQDLPVLRETVPTTIGSRGGAGAESNISELSPALLLSLLNHQLYDSTPAEKYATLFLGIYDGSEGRITYSNGGHLPPIVMAQDGSVRLLDRGGTVVGLFDDQSYEEGSVPLRSGELFLAYSDGVTEPENDFGEFGEERLIDLLRENRNLPLDRISEIITAAVDDWIGAREQPDDITLVLARAR
jgi:sigma-B regulation protein RsbU (phosphoserine phosphatase)